MTLTWFLVARANRQRLWTTTGCGSNMREVLRRKGASAKIPTACVLRAFQFVFFIVFVMCTVSSEGPGIGKGRQYEHGWRYSALVLKIRKRDFCIGTSGSSARHCWDIFLFREMWLLFAEKLEVPFVCLTSWAVFSALLSKSFF